VLLVKAIFPKAELVATALPPLPTVRPEMVASPVTVRAANVGEPPVTAIVPEALGSVTTTAPATVGA
jgi:hypothetical protein